MFLTTTTKKQYSKLNCNSQLAASDIMEEKVPRLIPAWQHDISFTLKAWMGKWLMNIAARRSCSGAPIPGALSGCQMYCDWVWMHRCSPQFRVTQGRTRYVEQFFIRSGVNCIILLPYSHLIFSVSLSRWLFYKSTCIVYAFCGVLFGLCSLSNLTALSCVCWLKVCCPNYGKTNPRMCASMIAL